MEKEKTLEILERMKAYYVRYQAIDPAYCEESVTALEDAIDAVKHKGEGALETFTANFTDAVAQFLNGLDEGDSKADKPALDEVEKKYLGSIIRPFRKRIIGITKQTHDGEFAYILISVKSSRSDNICLPFFRTKSGMYSGMKPNCLYTLEELGL